MNEDERVNANKYLVFKGLHLNEKIYTHDFFVHN